MSNTQVLPVGPNPTLTIDEVSGHLTVTGWNREELFARGPKHDELHYYPETGRVELHCDRNCLLQTPLQTRLKAESLSGNVAVNLVLGAVDLEQVDGNLQINSTGPFTLGHVDGNLSVRAVAGSLTADGVDDNARIYQIAGDLRLGKVDGNLSASEVVGNIEAEVEGNAQLRINLARGQHIRIKADGNIVLQVQPDAAAKVRLEADGKIRVANLGEDRKGRDTCLEFELGEGSGSVIDLRSDGDILLIGGEVGSYAAAGGFEGAGFGAAFAGAGLDPELGEEMGRRAEELGRQISEQVEQQVAAFTRDMEEKMSRMNNDEMADRIQDKITAAMRRAEEKLAEAMRRMEVRTQEAERRGYEGDRRRKGYGWQAPPSPPPAPQPPPPPKRPQATDEERMMILRMVEQGKISVEQAEVLLSALNG